MTFPVAAPVGLTARGWGFLIGAAVAGVAWQVLELQDLRYLMVLPAVMVVFSLVTVLSVAVLSRVQVTVRVPASTVTVGEPVVCPVVVSARWRVRVRLGWALDRQMGILDTVAATARSGLAETPVQFRPARRGVQWCGVATVEFPGPLGLARRRVQVMKGHEILVVPRALDDVPAEVPGPVARQAGAGVESGPVTATPSGSPAGSVRDFRYGDPVSQVHWKQSARLGKLLVNQYESAEIADAHVMLAAGAGEHPDAASFEIAVSATVTIADRLLEEGYRVILHCAGHPDSAVGPCTDEDAVREYLAVVETVPDAGLDGGLDAGSAAGTVVVPEGGADVVVTGVFTDALADGLAATGFTGDLVTVSGGTVAVGTPQQVVQQVPQQVPQPVASRASGGRR